MDAKETSLEEKRVGIVQQGYNPTQMITEEDEKEQERKSFTFLR